MRQSRWGVCTSCGSLIRLFRQFGSLDDVLDGLLLRLALLVVAPPDWPLVLALQAEMFACLALRLPLVAFLSPESASETAWILD